MSEHWPYDVMAEKDREIDDLKRQLAGSESRASEILGHYKAEKARREQADAMLDELDELLRDYMPARIGLAKTVLARRSGECWTRDEDIQDPTRRRSGGEA